MSRTAVFEIPVVNGSSIERGLKLFKAGTVKDSLGHQRTWSADDLRAMVENFNTLKSLAGFDPPVRVDHTDSARDVVGWIKDVSTDGEFLYGDIEFTEPDAHDKFRRGTYKPRSSEIGAYETNGSDPKTYEPTLFGVAFVDIPAVENLYGRPHQGDAPMEFKMNGHLFQLTEPAAVQAHIDQLEAAAKFSVNGAEVSDHSTVQAHIVALEAGRTPVTFKIKGADTTDHAAVQAHIVGMEGALEETRKSNRQAFVKALADGRKIGAPQVEALSALAVGMSDEQFEAFKTSYDAAPVLPLFAAHGAGPANATGTTPVEGGEENPLDKDIRQQEAILANLRRVGGVYANVATLEKTAAFQRLTELKQQRAALGR